MSVIFKYLHTNLTVKDIEKMREFYVSVFGFVPVREIQHLDGNWIEKITRVDNGEIKYVHLLFHGYQTNGQEL